MKKSVIFSLVLLMLVVSGCNFPKETAAPEQAEDAMATEISKILTGTPINILPDATQQEEPPTPTLAVETQAPPVVATPSPTTTATTFLAETDPALTLGEPDWVDLMDDGDNWLTGTDQYTSIKFEDGFLKLTAETDFYGWRQSWPYLDDFYLEVKLKTAACGSSEHYGLMFRADANKGYLFGITCDGKYNLNRWDGQNMYYPISWTKTDAIISGKDEVNTLGVMANGANLTLYINGQEVKEISDTAYLAGNFGVFVGSNHANDLTIWVDQIRYWNIP